MPCYMFIGNFVETGLKLNELNHFSVLACIFVRREEILNIYFVSVIAPNMLTKCKITVTPNNILNFYQSFE